MTEPEKQRASILKNRTAEQGGRGYGATAFAGKIWMTGKENGENGRWIHEICPEHWRGRGTFSEKNEVKFR
jgi:hypothetical protein